MADDTKTRLLEAARELFSKQSYDKTTIQQIAARAGANIAAVNYHFGGKGDLYAEVVRTTLEETAGVAPQLADNPDDPVGQLREFVRWFLRRLISAKKSPLFLQLAPSQMVAPEDALDAIVSRMIVPTHAALREIVVAIIGPQPDDVIRRCVISVLSQCVVYHMARPILGRLYDDFGVTEARLDALTEHVFTFSLAGLRAVVEEA